MEQIKKGIEPILLIIIGGLILWNVFTTNTIKTDINGYQKKIENIQTKIDSAKLINSHIDDKVGEVKENVKTITENINHIDNNIKVIKKHTDEKVNSIDTIPDSELELFFTNKYEQPISNSNK